MELLTMKMRTVLLFLLCISFGCKCIEKNTSEKEITNIVNHVINYLIYDGKAIKTIKDELSNQKEYTIYIRNKTLFLSYEDFALQVAKKICNCEALWDTQQYKIISDSLRHIDNNLVNGNQFKIKIYHKVIASGGVMNKDNVNLYLFVGKPFNNTIRIMLSVQPMDGSIYQFNTAIEYLIYYDNNYDILNLFQHKVIYG